MRRLTFGITSSPFLATRVLRKIADDYEDEYLEAAQLIRTAFYVDDCLTGAAILPQAIQLREDINNLLAKVGMTLRKWRTSSPELRETIPLELREE